MMSEKIKLGNLEVDLRELAQFIAKAKKNCYAGNGKEGWTEDGSKILTFQEGDFHCTDNYDGFYQASGSKIVRWQKPNGQRIWQMNYAGGMYEEFWGNKELAKQTFGFLKEVLMQVTPENPFRGPKEYNSKKPLFCNLVDKEMTFNYECRIEISRDITSDIKSFNGWEKISVPEVADLFFQNFNGGLVIPK